MNVYVLERIIIQIYWRQIVRIESEIRITTSFKIDKTIRDKFKIYCIEKELDMSDVLEKLIEKELSKK